MKKFADNIRGLSLTEVMISVLIMLVFFSPVLMVFRNVKSSEIDTQKISEITFMSLSIFEILKSTPYKDICVGDFVVNEDYLLKHLHSTYDKKQVESFQNFLEHFLYLNNTRKIRGEIRVEEKTDAFGTVKIARLNLGFTPAAAKNDSGSVERGYRFNFIFKKDSLL